MTRRYLPLLRLAKDRSKMPLKLYDIEIDDTRASDAGGYRPADRCAQAYGKLRAFMAQPTPSCWSRSNAPGGGAGRWCGSIPSGERDDGTQKRLTAPCVRLSHPVVLRVLPGGCAVGVRGNRDGAAQGADAKAAREILARFEAIRDGRSYVGSGRVICSIEGEALTCPCGRGTSSTTTTLTLAHGSALPGLLRHGTYGCPSCRAWGQIRASNATGL